MYLLCWANATAMLVQKDQLMVACIMHTTTRCTNNTCKQASTMYMLCLLLGVTAAEQHESIDCNDLKEHDHLQ